MRGDCRYCSSRRRASLGVAAGLDLELGPRKQDPRRTGGDLFGLIEGAVRLREASAAREKVGQIEDAADLPGGEFDGPLQMGFGAIIKFFLFGQLCQSVLGFGWIQSADPVHESLGHVCSAAEEARGFEVMGEEIVQGLFVLRVERHRFFEALAGFGGVRGGDEHVGGFGASAPCAAEPQPDAGIRRARLGGLFQRVDGLLVVPEQVECAAEQEEGFRAARLRGSLEQSDGLPVFGALGVRTGPGEIGRRERRHEQQAGEPEAGFDAANSFMISRMQSVPPVETRPGGRR